MIAPTRSANMSAGAYATFEEKYTVVENIDYGGTIAGLLVHLGALKSAGYVFRGQSEAFWPIVSSAQRAYASYQNNEYLRGRQACTKKFLCYLAELLLFAKLETNLLPRFGRRNKTRRCHYDHEIWGWLQHYSYATPFIDFSEDPYVALFMAVRDLSEKTACSKMFSVYALRGEYECGKNELIRLEKFIKGQQNILKLTGLDDKGMYEYDTWKMASCLTIHKDRKLNPWDSSLGADRIASQKGLFVYLGRHDISLERYLACQDEMNHDGEGEGCILERIKCFDIPVSLAPCVMECCRKHRCTEQALGLENQKIDSCLKSLNRRFNERIAGR